MSLVSPFLTMITLNVNGLNYPIKKKKKRHRISGSIKKTKPGLPWWHSG